MTREEILNMPAGREMDALVAKFVMKVDSPHDVYKFSTDIADAWTVVEHMVNNGYCPGLLFDDNGHWALAFDGAQSLSIGDEPDDVSTSFFVEKNLWCDTAPLAICRAALLAVMEAE